MGQRSHRRTVDSPIEKANTHPGALRDREDEASDDMCSSMEEPGSDDAFFYKGNDSSKDIITNYLDAL